MFWKQVSGEGWNNFKKSSRFHSSQTCTYLQWWKGNIKVYGALKQANFYFFWSACWCGLACSLFPGTWLSRSLSSAMTKEFPVCWPTHNRTRAPGGSCSWHQAPVLRPAELETALAGHLRGQSFHHDLTSVLAAVQESHSAEPQD